MTTTKQTTRGQRFALLLIAILGTLVNCLIGGLILKYLLIAGFDYTGAALLVPDWWSCVVIYFWLRLTLQLTSERYDGT